MRKRYIIIAVVVLLLIAGGIGAYAFLRNGRNTLPAKYYSNLNTHPTARPPALDHVVIIVDENKPEGSIIGSQSDPYISKLADTYAVADNYYGVTHPSLPNYLALTSGTTNGISSDCNPPSSTCEVPSTNIADRLEQAGKTWKEYANSMPLACDAENSGNYAVKHNPFMYYPDISTNKNRCQSHVVPYSQFSKDLATTTTLPNYSFITPNLCDDMHDCSVQSGDQWLAQQVPAILHSPAFTQQHSLLVITWDEANRFNNKVAAIFAGPAAKTHYTSNNYYSHYSLLHTIEWAWGLKPLTVNDATAPIMNDMLQQSETNVSGPAG